MLLRCIKMTSRAEKTHIESIGASAFASHAEIGSAAAAQIEPSDTLCVERLTAKNTAIIAAKHGQPRHQDRAPPRRTRPFRRGTRSTPASNGPTMHAAPASALPASPAIADADQHCAPRFSPRRAQMWQFRPSCRKRAPYLVAPALPLPFSRTSPPYTRFDSGIDAQNEPSRYAMSTIIIYVMVEASMFQNF